MSQEDRSYFACRVQSFIYPSNQSMIIESNVVEYQISDSKITEERVSVGMTELDMIVPDLTQLLQQHGLESTKAFETANNFIEKVKRIHHSTSVAAKKSSLESNIHSEVKGQDLNSNLQQRKKPSPPAITVTTNTDGTRTFRGPYSEHWKVGKWVELNHRYFTWLPGTVTRARFTKQGEVYDVKLSNGDLVLNVSSDKLRTWWPFWLEVLCMGAVALIAAVLLIGFCHTYFLLQHLPHHSPLVCHIAHCRRKKAQCIKPDGSKTVTSIIEGAC